MSRSSHTARRPAGNPPPTATESARASRSPPSASANRDRDCRFSRSEAPALRCWTDSAGIPHSCPAAYSCHHRTDTAHRSESAPSPARFPAAPSSPRRPRAPCTPPRGSNPRGPSAANGAAGRAPWGRLLPPTPSPASPPSAASSTAPGTPPEAVVSCTYLLFAAESAFFQTPPY